MMAYFKEITVEVVRIDFMCVYALLLLMCNLYNKSYPYKMYNLMSFVRWICLQNHHHNPGMCPSFKNFLGGEKKGKDEPLVFRALSLGIPE